MAYLANCSLCKKAMLSNCNHCPHCGENNFVIGSVRIGNLIVADRNLGAPEGGTALNYTNDRNHPDHKNSSFKGYYYTWEEAQNACPRGWRLPTRAELELISDAMQFSEGGAYLADGEGNRCYFPLSGDSQSPSDVYGGYWSNMESGDYFAWSMYVYATSASHYGRSHGLSVRCVKTVP